ncbi:dynamin family protein [Aeromonas dhakensis]|nr:dynamin family protein [Aeromonas dhakensis]
MANAVFTKIDDQAMRERYALICQACESTVAGAGNQQLELQLQALEQIIEWELPALARKGSPDNITDLLQALRMEMTRFREFCEYPALPSKVVVGLGGSFSAGKSSLINALIGDRKCLVTEVDPTTSLPTYLVQGKGDQTEVHAINLFNRAISLSHEQFRTLTHEEKSRYGSQVSRLLKSVVVAHPALPWGNLALLDTPGYSKADQVGSERTDANLARAQLNSTQFIVWLVPADKGTITEEDIAFLGTLDRAIPKLVVISRADKHPAEEIEKIVALVRDTLAKRGLSAIDVIPFSNRPRSNYSTEPLLDYFAQWNKARRELGFAQQFKRQFMGYQRFIYEEKQHAQRLLGKFNRILALTDDGDIQDDIGIIQRKCKVELVQQEQMAKELVEVQSRFFSQLKKIGDRVGIPLPEPGELSLLIFEPINLSHLLLQLADEWGVDTEVYDPILWAVLMRSQHIPSMDKILRRDRPSYTALFALKA